MSLSLYFLEQWALGGFRIIESSFLTLVTWHINATLLRAFGGFQPIELSFLTLLTRQNKTPYMVKPACVLDATPIR